MRGNDIKDLARAASIAFGVLMGLVAAVYIVGSAS